MYITQELRIGNWAARISYNRREKVYTNTQVDGEDIGYLSLGEASFEPIPLTEDWLLKFGLTEGTSNSWFIEWGYQTIEINPILQTFNAYGPDACISAHGFNGKIQYVHQLQNLFYALTQTELELTTTPNTK